MTLSVTPMTPAELGRITVWPGAGVGALGTERGNLPLDRLDVRSTITGLVATTVVTTEFVNVHDVALEATYVFPLPDRAAVTGMTMTADGRTVEAELKERGDAREQYDRAVAAGQRASIAEEERPDVFTMRVGNLVAGERVTVELRLTGPLPYEDGAATFRFPLVVAPRYVPGVPLPGAAVGDGTAADTDAVPDASRITPPVLLPGFPNPLRLSVVVEVDPAGLELGEITSSLHTLLRQDGKITIHPDERADRDFVLRLAYAGSSQAVTATKDTEGDEGTYRLTLLPPDVTGGPRPKDVVLLLDRSGSMGGWKMVAARRAAARVVDTLTAADRFAVLAFDHEITYPDDLGTGLVEATDRNRFRAVEHLARADARGGTEMLNPLRTGLGLLADSERDRVLVLVTDGQVGNEDQILAEITPRIGATRVHTVGVDRAVNAGFLGRLAAIGAGRTELVESEDRLDEAMEQIHRRIGSPLVTGLAISAADGFTIVDGTSSPARLPGLYAGVPLVVTGRFTGAPGGTVTVTGKTRDGQEFRAGVPVRAGGDEAVTRQWARARLRDLEDRYAAGTPGLEEEIVAISLRFGVLCRFTAFVAVDARVVNEGGQVRRVTQPVESPSGWEMGVGAPFLAAGGPPPPMPAPAPGGGSGFRPMLAKASFAPTAGGGGRGGAMPRGRAAAPGGAPRSTGGPSFGSAPAAAPPKPFAPARSAPRQDSGLADVLAVEARRLDEGRELPGYERAEMLEDLATRLTVLLDGVTDPRYAPLIELVTRLTAAAGELEERWADALRVLSGFTSGTAAGADSGASGGGPSGVAPTGGEAGPSAKEVGARPARKPFWKRG